MALESTQPLTEISTRNISWVIKADNLTTFLCQLSGNLGVSVPLEPSGPVQACNGIALPLPYQQLHIILKTHSVFKQHT
jgi:hypothetical protein